MTTERTLEILQAVHEKMSSMTEEELYVHMYKNSPSFREIADTADKMINDLYVFLETGGNQFDDSFSDSIDFSSFSKPVEGVKIEISSEGSTCLTAA